MNYYAEDTSSRKWACAVTALWTAAVGAALLFVSFDFERRRNYTDAIYIVEQEPPVPPAPARVETAPTQQPRHHAQAAAAESFDRSDGNDSEVRTVNPRALFNMAKSGPDAPEQTGNPRAEKGAENLAAGTGSGLDPFAGTLDAGLQGRGLAGALPKPAYTADASGKVVVEVTVDASGKVVKAAFRAMGSTTNNAELVEAARRAALKARFAESEALMQTGTITYIFKMQ